MDSLHTQLHLWAEQFHKPTFIANDPIQIPHRYQCQQDIEISGFLTAYLLFGRRGAIIDAANPLDTMVQSAPPHAVLFRELGV